MSTTTNTPKLDALFARIRKLIPIEQRGAITELAGAIDRKPSHVWEWINGQHAPGGEATLELLEWADNEERGRQLGDFLRARHFPDAGKKRLPGSVAPRTREGSQQVKRHRRPASRRGSPNKNKPYKSK